MDKNNRKEEFHSYISNYTKEHIVNTKDVDFLLFISGVIESINRICNGKELDVGEREYVAVVIYLLHISREIVRLVKRRTVVEYMEIVLDDDKKARLEMMLKNDYMEERYLGLTVTPTVKPSSDIDEFEIAIEHDYTLREFGGKEHEGLVDHSDLTRVVKYFPFKGCIDSIDVSIRSGLLSKCIETDILIQYSENDIGQ